MNYSKANINQIEEVFSVYSAAIKHMEKQEIHQWDEIYPQYGFASHKGYGTAKHIQAIKEYGICSIHRKSFVKNFIQK